MLVAVLPQTDPIRAAYAGLRGRRRSPGSARPACCWWGAQRTGARIRLVRPRLTPEIEDAGRGSPCPAPSPPAPPRSTSSSPASWPVAGRRHAGLADRGRPALPAAARAWSAWPSASPCCRACRSAVQTEDHDDAQAAMDQAVVFALALSLPAAAALMAMPVLPDRRPVHPRRLHPRRRRRHRPGCCSTTAGACRPSC